MCSIEMVFDPTVAPIGYTELFAAKIATNLINAHYLGISKDIRPWLPVWRFARYWNEIKRGNSTEWVFDLEFFACSKLFLFVIAANHVLISIFDIDLLSVYLLQVPLNDSGSVVIFQANRTLELDNRVDFHLVPFSFGWTAEKFAAISTSVLGVGAACLQDFYISKLERQRVGWRPRPWNNKVGFSYRPAVVLRFDFKSK